ncbi:YdcH family protein [Granulosicoccus sp. 3-233]|uniref:YdcH family protein n=1 Tax=Granulosicoccus sp. 3-233 TaxID=3417969 RepID=UPI003D3371E8
MSQLVDNHPLARDLPEHKQTIHAMKMNDAHFSRIMEEYEALDKEIVRIEQGLEHVPDLELDGMKMKRVKMKDDLLALLQQS